MRIRMRSSDTPLVSNTSKSHTESFLVPGGQLLARWMGTGHSTLKGKYVLVNMHALLDKFFAFGSGRVKSPVSTKKLPV